MSITGQDFKQLIMSANDDDVEVRYKSQIAMYHFAGAYIEALIATHKIENELVNKSTLEAKIKTLHDVLITYMTENNIT